LRNGAFVGLVIGRPDLTTRPLPEFGLLKPTGLGKMGLIRLALIVILCASSSLLRVYSHGALLLPFGFVGE
jgi:hypothetical protein